MSTSRSASPTDRAGTDSSSTRTTTSSGGSGTDRPTFARWPHGKSPSGSGDTSGRPQGRVGTFNDKDDGDENDHEGSYSGGEESPRGLPAAGGGAGAGWGPSLGGRGEALQVRRPL